VVLTLLLVAGAGPALGQHYIPHRVFDTRARKFIDFEVLAERASRADVVFFGEEHDHLDTHWLEFALLQAVDRRRGTATVALEMFERDVQEGLSDYLAGRTTEDDFLAASRPWPRYRDHYRGLVEFARSRGWPVVASNVPRRIASLVSRRGLAALDSLPEADRPLVAGGLECQPRGKYFERFSAELAGMPSHGTGDTTAAGRAAQLVRVYQAQCLKDETMAESVARSAVPGSLVIHYNGAFHSDYRLGTVERVRRRVPDAPTLVISAVPVPNLDSVAPTKQDRKVADILLFVLKPPPPPADSGRRAAP
jgi:uncharacterized iron-regulated protein